MRPRKLTDDIEAEIVSALKLRNTLTDKALADRYNVSRSTLINIRKRARARSVTARIE